MKKWILTQMWRVQQVAMLASLSLLALNLALTMNQYIAWRFSNSYYGTLVMLTSLVFIVWMFGYIWDKYLQLWKEQNIVSIERNPYSTIQMTPKEVMTYMTIWIPWLEERGAHAEANIWKKYVAWNLNNDVNLNKIVSKMMDGGIP